MKNFKFLFQLFAYSLLLLILPTLASAQYRGNRDNDDYNRNNGRYNDNGRYNNNNYDNRELRDAISRVKSDSKKFKSEIDTALDRSRYDGSRREDRINDVAKDFAGAAERLKNSYNNGRDYNNSSSNAQEVIQLGNRIDRIVNGRGFNDNSRSYERAASIWSNIRQDLNIISNAYGNNNRGYGNNGRNNGNYDNGRNNGNRRGNRYPY